VTRDQAVLLAVCGLLLVCVVLCLVLLVALRRVRAGAGRVAEELGLLRQRLDDLEQTRVATPAAAAPATPVEFVITDLGQDKPASEPASLDGPAFADIVLKETVVKAASLAHGLRRGLAPATRNRIRFEMRQEVRRARKQRRADLKAAQRDLHARQRGALRVDAGEAS
jgi:hypothetical protein